VSDDTLSDIFTNPQFHKFYRKKFKFSVGQQLLVPPQGQIRFIDRISGTRRFCERELQQKSPTSAGIQIDLCDYVEGMSRGFILAVVGETGRGSVAGTPADSHATGMPGYLVIHKKYYFAGQICPNAPTSRFIQTVGQHTPALNATPIVYGGSNNIGTIAG